MSEIAELKLVVDAAINYAFQQNAIPVVKELWLRNGEVARQNVVVRVSTEPAFAEPVEFRIQSLAPGGEFRAAPVDLKLGHDFLGNLPERVAGWLRIEVVEGETQLHFQTQAISLLAPNEWCGLVSLPEILAAFVLPNDPAVMTVLGRAAELLRVNTGRAAFNGYQDKNRKRSREQAAAIYRAIAELGIRYIAPPASFESSGQKVRFPSDILEQRFATCLDLVLLVAACCEQAGLHPLVLIHDGHAYAGVWLDEQTLAESATDDLQHIRKLRELDALTVFETTTLADEKPGTLDQAERLGSDHLLTTQPFRLALDVRRSRLARIRPLPIAGQATSVDAGSGGVDKASDGIGDREVAEPILPVVAPAKAATRIDQWKSRLLDLSLRNRLLNLKETKATIRILSASPEHVEDELAGERELALLPKPRLLSENDPRNAATMTSQQRTDALREHLVDELRHKRLHTTLDELEHPRRLTELFRAARTSIEENGTNTLFAAVGLLEWRETEHSDRVLRAPLLLMPVELKRRSVLEGFSLRRIDEETRLNVTLMEMLRQHFRKEVPGLDPLPEDENGVDVGRVFQIFRDAVRNMPGWEVKTEIWLGQFSFTKFLLWKDLADRLDDLVKNRIVKHLVTEGGSPYPNPPDDIKPAGLDARFHPKEVFCPRSADSSQLAAVMASAAGHDFVLEGPPGTGKSQTITNIIAHCLARGKRVLFVAEKRAALDVVHRRLREDGLEPFCLELHSNKTGKTDVLAQFDRALKFASQGNAADWERRASELEEVRRSLNVYTQALHDPFACGLSPFHCLDYLLPRREQPTVKLDGWAPVLETPVDKLEKARETARLLQDRARPVAPPAGHPLSLISFEEWSPTWAEDALEQVAKTHDLALESAAATKDLLASFQWPRTHASRTERAAWAALVESLQAAEPVGEAFTTTPWNQLAGDLDRWAALARERAQMRAELRRVHAAKGDAHGTLVCEDWTPDQLARALDNCRSQEDLAVAAQSAVREFRRWLKAPTESARKGELLPLAELIDSLLAAPALGASFAATEWTLWSAEFDRWTSLVAEREQLRRTLAGFDEVRLLKLNLDSLSAKWASAPTSWFLIRMIRVSSVRGALRGVRTDRTAPAPADIAGILATSLRLRAINGELAAAHPRATSLLGPSWRNGESTADELARVRAWAVSFDARLRTVCDADSAWRSRAGEALGAWLPSAPTAMGPGSDLGNKLARSRDQVTRCLADVDRTLNETRLDTASLDASSDYFGALGNAFAIFRQSAPQLAKTNAEFAACASTARACLGELWRVGEPLRDELLRLRAWGEQLHPRVVAVASGNIDLLVGLRQHLGRVFSEGRVAFGEGSTFRARLVRFADSGHRMEVAFDQLGAMASLERAAIDNAPDQAGALAACCAAMREAWGAIREWCSWRRARHQALDLGLGALVATVEAPGATNVDLPGLFERSFRKALLFTGIESRPALRNFFGAEHGTRIEKFRELDDRLQKLARELIAARLAARIPREDSRGDIPKSESALLSKEIGKKTRHVPVRKLIGGIPTLLSRLKPCVLMSPLSVAQYLDAAQTNFDVVIFDEASQIPVWDAVGAIARGTQLIVVGDPKQLPPTNFFNSTEDEDEDLTAPEMKDLESILDELLTNGLRHKRLQWHYRSRHEGLISFSNRQYYENDLLTFPSPETLGGGVRFRHLPEARYDKGKSRTNKREAEALVAELVARLRRTDGPARSFGVVTFSQAQQSLVENLLDEERRKYPEIETHFGDAPPIEGEPVFVKNLENVQGDERDVILFSICYGPDDAGKVSMNFGPLNKEGGERRLNVAVTRAKHEVLVFSGLRADQIDLTRTRARGVRDLKLFLDYAERGPRVLASASVASRDAEAESEFERLVAARLQAAGHDVHHQVGCSDYRIDLAVVDPAAPGRYLLGIECDGATYHRAATARDRDKLRQAVLEGLGWKLYRIWSTDWWHNPDGEMKKLLATIEKLKG